MISIAYSPCPNDTFLFYNLVRGKIPDHVNVTEELWDVENLNEFAKQGKYPVTKISFAAYFSVLEKYILLETGSALGRGCGPLVVRKKGSAARLETSKNILVPGLLTTANLLLSLHSNTNHPIPTRYDYIIPKLLSGEAELGVIIHEERFTFEERGLEKVIDLGEWWETETGLPIPLGAIAIRRDIDRETALKFQDGLKKSLELAYQDSDAMYRYIKENSQNKEDAVIKAHIELYVNSFTKSLGEEGHKAIQFLYERAVKAGFIKPNLTKLPFFLGE
jgi:predicted solute-binding protein